MANAESARIDTLGVPVVLVGNDGRISYANAAARVALGPSPQNLHGSRFVELLGLGLGGELAGLRQAFQKRGRYAARAWIRCSDGLLRDAALSIESCLNNDGQIVAASVSFRLVLDEPFVEPEAAPAQSGEHPVVRTVSDVHELSPKASAHRRPEPEPELDEDDDYEDYVEPSKETRDERMQRELTTLSQLLRWTDHCLSAVEPNSPSEAHATRARFILSEARELLTLCQGELSAAKSRAREG